MAKVRAVLAASLVATGLVVVVACDSGGGPVRGAGGRRIAPGFCGRVATSFKVSIQTFTPPRPDEERADAGDDDEDDDAGLSDAGADADASDVTLPSVQDGGGLDAGGRPNPSREGRMSLFALSVRTGAGSGISLKDATFTMKKGKMLSEPRQSELLTEIDVDTSMFAPEFSIEVKLAPTSTNCKDTLLFQVTLRDDGKVASIKAFPSDSRHDAGEFGFENLSNEL